MNTKPTMGEALARTKTEVAPRREKIYNSKSTPARRGLRGITTFVHPQTIEDLNSIKEQLSNERGEDVRQQDVVREGINLVLVKYGRKPTA